MVGSRAYCSNEGAKVSANLFLPCSKDVAGTLNPWQRLPVPATASFWVQVSLGWFLNRWMIEACLYSLYVRSQDRLDSHVDFREIPRVATDLPATIFWVGILDTNDCALLCHYE